MRTRSQLRYLQTLLELASERTSTLIFPVPIDTLETFMHAAPLANGAGKREDMQAQRGATLSCSEGVVEVQLKRGRP